MALSLMEREIAASKRDAGNVSRESRRAGLMEAEQDALDRQGDAYARARQRWLDSQRMTAIADPGRYAPSVRQEALEWQRTGRLRAHELAVADKGIEQERVKSGIRADADREIGRTQHGYFDENGNYVPGSAVWAAEASGLWKSELQNSNWRNRNEQTRLQEEG